MAWFNPSTVYFLENYAQYTIFTGNIMPAIPNVVFRFTRCLNWGDKRSKEYHEH